MRRTVAHVHSPPLEPPRAPPSVLRRAGGWTVGGQRSSTITRRPGPPPPPSRVSISEPESPNPDTEGPELTDPSRDTCTETAFPRICLRGRWRKEPSVLLSPDLSYSWNG